MADIHDRPVIASAGVATDQNLTATLGSHMTQSYGGEFAKVERRHHAAEFAPPVAFRQLPCAPSSPCRCLRWGNPDHASIEWHWDQLTPPVCKEHKLAISCPDRQLRKAARRGSKR